jgi:hypothetical protein
MYIFLVEHQTLFRGILRIAEGVVALDLCIDAIGVAIIDSQPE